MFVVLAQPRTRQSCSVPGAVQAQPAIRVSGDVDYGRIAVFAHLDGQRLTCTSGRLWLTIENDPNDYVLRPQERMVIPGSGKVVIGGRGSYSI
jgi:hypothetical protein